MIAPTVTVRLVSTTLVLLGLFGLAPARPAHGQNSLEVVCEEPLVTAADAREACVAAVQAAVSGQSALGILIAGGNPTPGGAEPAGLGLGLAPRASLGLRVQLVSVELPDIISEQIADELDFVDTFGAVAPALAADLSLRLFDGFELMPGVSGVGGLSLLGNATYLPFEMFTDELDAAHFAYGLGGRLHLLSESFSVPATSISLMWRRLPDLEFGDVCRGVVLPVGGDASEGVDAAACPGNGDAGEIAFDLTDLSGRAVVSKQLLGLGTALGFGFDRLQSDLDFGFRGAEVSETGTTPVFRARNREIHSTRWTVFGNLSYTAVVVSLTAEAGWQQGKAPIRGFSNLGGDFDPREGTWYGSFGARLSL